jgi:peroxiredoxin
VVAQKSESVRRFIEETGLPFNILVDESRSVLKAYGVWHRIGLDAFNIARPALFVISPDGRIPYSFVADRQHEFPSHQEIVSALQENASHKSRRE